MFIDVATVQERLDNFSALESQIAEDPANAPASVHLEMAYRQQGRTEELLQLLLTRAENVADDRERVGILRQAAEVCAHSGDAPSALMILLTAFDLERGDPDLGDELDRLAYATGQWDEVLDAYLLAAAESGNAQQSGGLWLRIACAHALVTGDSEAQAAALEHVLSVDTTWAQAYLDLVERQARGKEVLATLTELCERIGDRARQARLLTRSVAMTDSVIERADLHAQLAALQLSSDDRLAANYHLREALRLDPMRADCKAALIAMSKQQGDIRGAADMLRAEALLGAQNRGQAAYEAAKLYSELDENTRCFDLLSITMGEDPHHLGAAVPLAERHYQRQRWSELGPLLDLLLANQGSLPKDAPSPAELNLRAGECALALEDPARAQHFFSQAVTLDSHNRRALHKQSEVLQAQGDFEAAFQAAKSALALEGGEPNRVRAQTVFRMAQLRIAQERAADALPLAIQAAELDPSRIDCGLLVAKVHEAREEYRKAVTILKQWLAKVEPSRRVEIHHEIANLRCRKLDDPMGAIREYQRALQALPNDRKTMHALLELYSAAELWDEAVELILAIAELEEAPLRRGKYLDAAGEIIRQRAADQGAIDCFNRALDCFFVHSEDMPENMRHGCMRPFHRIVEHLHEQEDYESLERNYRMMIQRLGKEDPQVVHLWQELGQLYRGKLNRPEDAIASYEVVSALDESSNHKRILLDLYEQSPDQIDKAIAKRHEQVEADPFAADNYSALCELYLRSNEADRAWCATRALVVLGQASEAQKTFYYQNQPTEMRWPRVPIALSMWADLRHVDENPLVRSILSLVSDAVALSLAVDEAGLLARDGNSYLHNELRDLARGVAFAMGMPPSRVTVDLELRSDLLLMPTQAGPCFVVGRDVWQAPSIRARVHAIARVLASARPDAILRHLCKSPQELEAVFMAALTMARPDIGVPPALAAHVAHTHKVLHKRLSPSRKLRLAHAVEALIASGTRHDSLSWWHAVDCSSQRVALLLSGDLQVAVDGMSSSGQPSQEAMADLLRFSMSTALGDMRRDLDIAACGR